MTAPNSHRPFIVSDAARQQNWLHQHRDTPMERTPLAWGAITYDAALGIAIGMAALVALLAGWLVLR